MVFRPSFVHAMAIAVFAIFLMACHAQTHAIPTSTNTIEPLTATATRMRSAIPSVTAIATATNKPTITPSSTRTVTSVPSVTPTPTPTPYPPERLAFAVGPGEFPAIAFINSDGTGFEREDYFGPYMYVNTESQSHMTGDFLAPSPNGRYLAFDGSEDAEFSSVYLADLSQGKVIGSIPNSHGWPFSWSPDSRYLVMSGYYYDPYNRNLFLYDVETGQTRPLTKGNGLDTYPTWSPNGQWIAFVHAKDVYPVYPCVDPGEGCDGLYMIHPDGSGLKFLTGDLAFTVMDLPYFYTWSPPWSPDSQWLSIINSSTREDVIINVNSGEIRTFGIYTWDRMGWTPDGRLYFTISPEGNSDIYTMFPDGSELANLTNSPGEESWPSWSSSGHFVAFYYYQEHYSLCVMNSDSTNRHCSEGITGKRIAWLPATPAP